MRIVAKFASVYFLASCLVFLLIGYGSAHRASIALRASTKEDLDLLAAAFADGVGTTWNLAGERAAVGTLRSLGSGRTDWIVRWSPSLPGEGPAVDVDVGRGSVEDSSDDFVRTRAPVSVRGDVKGYVELAAPVTSERRLFLSELKGEFPFALLLAVISGVLAVTVGGAVIGRPLGRIVDQARRIGEGDFSQRLRSDSTDEIGALKRELNAMCERLLDARDRLEEEATARTETLVQLRHLDRLRTVGTMASSIAHELGTPLNVILLRSHGLERGAELGDAEIRSAGETIAKQVEKMGRIVRQLLDYSRATTRPKSSVSAEGLVRHAASLLESLAKKHRVRIAIEVVSDEPIHGDEGQLEQALTNLMMNGIQAMPDGGVLTLRVESVKGTRIPRSDRTVDAVVLRVVDEGHGIAADHVDQLFEPFYTTKPAGVGTGLGLSVSKGIAEEHGGWIEATRSDSRGSIFSLYLPKPE